MDYSKTAQRISNLIDSCKSDFPEIEARDFWEKEKAYYKASGLSFREALKDMLFITRFRNMFNRDIQKLPSKVLKNSVLLLGPALSGKSSIANELSKQTGLDAIHMEDKKYLKSFYDRANFVFYKGKFLDRFKSIRKYKEARFPQKVFNNQRKYNMFLMSTVLESLKDPKIVCITEGFAYFNNPLMQYVFEEGLSKFKHKILVIPSQDKTVCSKVLTQRFKEKYDAQIHGTSEEREKVQIKLINSNDYLDHCLSSPNFSYVLTTNGKSIEDEVAELKNYLEKEQEYEI